MNRKGAILGSVTALTLLVSGVVVASSLSDLPQDAQPAQSPTADLNRQPTPAPALTPPPPERPVPQEPAPEAEPAPARPIAITPPAPVIIVAEEPEKNDDEDSEEAEAPVAASTEPAPPPGRRQRRRVAIVEAVDKITAERMRFEVEVGGRPVRFQKTLIFTARACEVSASDEVVQDSIAYLEVDIQPRGVLQPSGPRQIFRGWMFASAPAVNALEHPIYDAWVVGCRA
ncbi:hypothetical protein GCM10009116_19230 [Brevundimonas basaltis]|uniref:DUF2155 domain-containing protein n=1 Tax=Brevundimonas basaltis TaxID=472166 RepID=A0A7W8HW41_9CAUL|nr:DUF2155 domain-containing protein [Brevundimonas basaltis]MBB5290769.1 hypothetical protein [Brevundimonas basaltis]